MSEPFLNWYFESKSSFDYLFHCLSFFNGDSVIGTNSEFILPWTPNLSGLDALKEFLGLILPFFNLSWIEEEFDRVPCRGEGPSKLS